VGQDEEINFEICNDCNPDIESKPKLPIEEITQYMGHDYIAQPHLTPYQNDLDVIFAKKPSMEELIIGNDMHLQRLLSLGMTMDAFVKYGYRWEDLKKFAALAKEGERRIAALFALQCTADHFRLYPDNLPIKEMKITPKNLRDDFGLRFAANDGPLSVHGTVRPNSPWTLASLKQLGFNAEDVFAAGLYTYAQLESLFPDETDLNFMKFSQTQIDNLWPPRQVRKHVTVAVAPVNNNNNNNNNNSGGIIVFDDNHVIAKKKYCGLK